MNPELRWFVVVPPVGQSRIQAQRIANAVQQEFGSATYIYDSQDALARIQSCLRNSEQSMLVDWMNQNLVVKALEQGATHVLCLSMAPVDPYYLNLLRSKNVNCVHWILDDIHIADYWRAVLHGYDMVVSNQKGSVVRECLIQKINYRFLPLAADTPVSGAGILWDARSLDIGFIGERSPYRVRMLETLAASGLKVGIQGDGWDREKGFLTRCILKRGQDSDYDLYRQSRIALHLSHGQPSNDGSNEPLSSNVYNSIALGALPFIEASPCNQESLQGLGYQEFRNLTELLAKCLHYRQVGVQSEYFVQNQQEIQKRHNLHHRVRELAAFL